MRKFVIISILMFCTYVAKAQMVDYLSTDMTYINSEVTIIEDARLSLILYANPSKFVIQLKRLSSGTGAMPTLYQESSADRKIIFAKSQWLQNTGDNTIGYKWSVGNGYTYHLYYTRGATMILVSRNGVEVGSFSTSENMGNKIEKLLNVAAQNGVIAINR